MIILYSSPASPFGRKVGIAAALLGLADRLDIRRANVNDEGDPALQSNPVGKIPVLRLADGTAVFDSRVILEYLDQLAGGGRILPSEPRDRIRALTLQAAADGILDAALLQVYEGRYRPQDLRHQPWLDRQAAKVARTLAVLEAEPPATHETPTVGEIALACALGYLDFRFAGTWRAAHPRLVAWLEDFAGRVPAFAATTPTD
jgi:glutathione S-transferase